MTCQQATGRLPSGVGLSGPTAGSQNAAEDQLLAGFKLRVCTHKTRWRRRVAGWLAPIAMLLRGPSHLHRTDVSRLYKGPTPNLWDISRH